jgi:hypothetical protein
MGMRGLQKPRDLWRVLFEQDRLDPHLWDIALARLTKHGCDICLRPLDPRTRSSARRLTPSRLETRRNTRERDLA